MAENSKRWIGLNGVAQGPYTLDELYDMAASNKISSQTTYFYSEIRKTWEPLAGVMMDVDPDQLEQMKKAGTKRVRVLAGGNDCRVCATICDKVFPIESPPPLPPVGCYCVPWCRLVLGAVKD